MNDLRHRASRPLGGPFRAQPGNDPFAESEVEGIEAEAAQLSRDKVPSVATAALIVAAGFLGSRLLGLLRTIVIARAFGTSPELDAYWVAFRLPDLIFQVLTGATLGAAFIPTFARHLSQRGPAEAWRLASSVLNLILITTTVAAVFAFIFAPILVPLLAPGLGDTLDTSGELHNLAVRLTRIMLISTVIFSISGMFMGILNARHHFLTPALAPMLYNLAIIFAALFLAGPLGVEGLAFAVVVGAALHLLVQLPGLQAVGMQYQPVADWRDPGVREVGRLMFPRVLGLGAAQLNFLITVFFASQVGEGAISAVNYGWLIVMLPLALFGMSISTAVFPTLAEQAATRNMEELRATIARSLRFILFLTVPASAGLMLVGKPVIALLLQRGAFTTSSTEITYDALLFYALGLFALAGTEILSRGFYALSDTRTPVVFAIVAMLVNFFLSALLVGPLEIRGLALAASLAAIIECGGLFRVLNRRLGSLEVGHLTFTVTRAVLATVLMAEAIAIFLLLFRAFFGPLTSSLNALIVLVLSAPLGSLIFLWAAHILGAEETDMLRERFQTWGSWGRDLIRRSRSGPVDRR